MIKQLQTDFTVVDARSLRLGLLFAAAGTLLITTNYVTVKAALAEFNPETFSFLWTASAAVYALVILASGRLRPVITPGWKELLPMVLIGLVNAAGALLSWKGLAALDPPTAAFLWRFHPIITILLGVLFLGERFLPVDLLPAAVMLIGTFVTVGFQWSRLSSGVLFILAAALANSIQMVLVKATLARNSPELLLFYRNAVGAACIAGLGLLTGTLQPAGASGWAWAVATLGSLLGETLSFLFLFKSLSYWGVSLTSLVRTVEPVLVVLWAFLLFGMFPGPRQILGGVLIMAGAILFSLLHYSKNKQPERDK